MKRIITLLFFLLFLILPYTVLSQKKELYEEGNDARRNTLQPPVKIMDVMGLKPGMTIGDIGAGRGRFAVWFADRV